MELQENLVVADRFKLVRLIGRGGMGSVWQAIQLALDQPCAVKFIEGEGANLAETHSRFEREAKAAAHLRSPHVVQILDHGVWEGRPFIAMELLEGEDLAQALARANGKLPADRLAGIIQQVCRALTKAHQAGIVHRDLKPENIFLVNDDDRQIVKILDFGVAKQTSQGIDGSNTKTGAMLGTPYFMSPEQAQGIKSVDARSDLWSLAVIVYLCLTGQRPFDSNALGDLLVKIIVAPVPVPSQVAPVPPGFDAWWARAAARSPDHRFQTAKEFGATLGSALGVAIDPSVTAKQAARTAFMMNAPGAQVAQAAQATSPHFAAPTPNPTSQPSPFMTTPYPVAGPALSDSVGAPAGTYDGASLGRTGDPAAASGAFAPAPPMKSPTGAIAAIAGVIVLGLLVGGGVLLARRGSTSTPAAPATSETASATAAPSAPPAPEPTQTAASASASAEPSPEASPEASSEPAASAEPTATDAATSTASAATTTKVAPKATSTGTQRPARPTAPAATTSSKRPSMGDDRKW